MKCIYKMPKSQYQHISLEIFYVQQTLKKNFSPQNIKTSDKKNLEPRFIQEELIGLCLNIDEIQWETLLIFPNGIMVKNHSILNSPKLFFSNLQSQINLTFDLLHQFNPIIRVNITLHATFEGLMNRISITFFMILKVERVLINPQSRRNQTEKFLNRNRSS